jgi:hypothetical protein
MSSFYIVKGGTLEAVGEATTLDAAVKGVGEQEPGTYDIVKVVKVGYQVAEVPATRRVIAGDSTTQRPNARGSRTAAAE